MNITPYLYVPFAAWAIAQIIKFSLALVRGEGDLRYLYASGGMPSVHSAVVCSLATWAFIDGGVGSPLFGITAVFAAIVMYDSFGVRRSAGEQARTLNRLIADLGIGGGLKNAEQYDELREILGHKPLEVIVGASLGILIAGIFGYSKLTTQFPVAFSVPGGMAAKVIMILGAVLLVTSPIKYVWGLKKYRKAKVARDKLTYISLVNAIVGIILIGVGLMAYENVYTTFAQWYMVGLIILLWLVVIISLVALFMQARPRVNASQDTVRKDEWLARSKTKNRKKKK